MSSLTMDKVNNGVVFVYQTLLIIAVVASLFAAVILLPEMVALIARLFSRT